MGINSSLRASVFLASHESVEPLPVCVVTRIAFVNRRWAVKTMLRFHALRRLARKEVPGLVAAWIRLEGRSALIFVSLWRDNESVDQFKRLTSHLASVRSTIDTGARIWSRSFDLRGTSSLTRPWLGPTRSWAPTTVDPIAVRTNGAQERPRPVCVVTRVDFPSKRAKSAAYWRFRSLRRIARKQIPGLLFASAYSQRRALFFVSLWSSERSLIQFTTLQSHVNAVRWTIRQGARVWSGVFALRGTAIDSAGTWYQTAWRDPRAVSDRREVRT